MCHTLNHMNMKLFVRTTTTLSALFSPLFALAQTSVGAVQSNAGGTFGVFYNSGIGTGIGTGIGYGLCTSNLCSVAQTLIYIINAILVPVLFAIAFIVFLYGVFKKYIWSRGDESAVEEGHKLILWGIIGFVVMVSLWGLVNVVGNTFGLTGYFAPQTPSSVSPFGPAGPTY